VNAIVVYSTRGGNTEKVALAIASELKCKLVKIGNDFDASTLPLANFDKVFIGTGIFGGEPSKDMLQYLKAQDFKDSNRQFALFITWAGGGKSEVLAFNRVKEYLEVKNQKLLDNCYKCFGATFGLARRDHPNTRDLEEARKWAKEATKTT
jgi:flavodoxin